MRPALRAVWVVGVAGGPTAVPTAVPSGKEALTFAEGLPFVARARPAAVGVSKSPFPKESPLPLGPFPTHYGVTLHKPGLTTAMFWYVQMSSCYYVLGFVFLLCLLHTSLPPVHPSLLLAFLTTHHPKENSLGLVQQGPLSPLTNEVCWHCNWWSSP